MTAAAKRVRRIRRNAEATIRAARSTGRLENCDDLLVALVRTAADACDEQRGYEGENQALRLAADLEARLRAVGGPSDDAFDRLLAAASRPAPPRHSA